MVQLNLAEVAEGDNGLQWHYYVFKITFLWKRLINAALQFVFYTFLSSKSMVSHLQLRPKRKLSYIID